MAQVRTCRECGLPLPEDAPGGACPVCSLQTALKFARHPAFEEQPAAPEAGRPPTPEQERLQRFGDYELIERVARGGMGVVYKARQVSLNRIVALKMIQGGTLAGEAALKRFHAEAEAIAHLRHPNIVAVHEVGEHEGQHFFSMDYVAGRTLADVVRDGPLSARRATDYLKTIAEAVHYAHEHGIIHRDLKPANVIIDDQDQPQITDFGLAKRFFETTDHGPLTAALTLSGQVLGSPNYLPPEQAEPKRGAPGPASDVYALGAILYHLVTGRPPFQAESLTTLLRQVVETDPVPLRSLNPSISRDLETICLKCLEKEPQRRYATAQDLADDLGRFLNSQPVLARPVGVAGKGWRWCRRQPVRAGLVGALALVLVLGVAGISWQWHRAEQARRTAVSNEQLALRQTYAGDMNLVQRSLEEGDLKRARALLERYRQTSETRNSKSELDLRGWEWRYLWGLCGSDAHLVLTQGVDVFVNLALAHDGELLAARVDTGNIELWDLTTRQHVGTLTNRGEALAMGFSANGRLASANVDDNRAPVISSWDVRTQQLVTNMPQPSHVTSLALSSDGQQMVTFHVEKGPRFRHWATTSGTLLREWPAREGFNGIVPLALFSPNGKTLALGENQGQIRLLDLTTGVTIEIPAPTEGNGVYALAFSSDGRLLASGYAWGDSAIRLWDVATGQSVGCLRGHQNFVEKLVFTPDGRTLYSAGFDQTIRIWDLRCQKQIGQLQGHTDRITGLVLCPDGQTLISCSWDGSLRVWDLGAPARPPAERELPVCVGPYGTLFTADSHRLITASPTNLVTLWDVATANQIERLPALGTNNVSVALSPDQRLLAVGGLDGALKVWDLASAHLVKEWRPFDTPVFRLCFFDRGTQLSALAIAPGFRTEFKRWEVASWREVPLRPGDGVGCLGVMQSPDQRYFALIGANPMQVFRCATGDLETTLGTESGFTPVFSHDGRFLAAAMRRRARVWEVGSWREMAVLEQTAGATYSVALSQDGGRLAVGSWVAGDSQPALRIWDYVVERELLRLYNHGPFTSWIEFSPDGRSVLAVSWSGRGLGVAKLWRAPSWAEIEAAEKATEP